MVHTAIVLKIKDGYFGSRIVSLECKNCNGVFDLGQKGIEKLKRTGYLKCGNCKCTIKTIIGTWG